MRLAQFKVNAVSQQKLPSAAMFFLLLAAMQLLVSWSLMVPVFEAPDEPQHWQVANYFHLHRRLAPYNPSYVEGNQPPLYYVLVSPFATTSAQPPVRATLKEGNLVLSCPPRLRENCPSDFSRYWPIRAVRLVTAFLSLGTVVFTILGAHEASGSRNTGVLAGAMVAFLPQFTFRAATVNNDAMVACTGAAATWCLVRFARRGSTRAALWCSLACAIAFLSKINAIIIAAAFVACAISLPLAWRERLRRTAFLLIPVVIVSPWLIRNRILYGDALATGIMPKVVPSLVVRKSITSSYFRTTFPTSLWHSYVGTFGWMNVGMPPLIYTIFKFLAIAGCMGIIIGLVRGRVDRRTIALLVLIIFLAIASVVQLNLTFSQPQGRYLFPALSACMVFIALGFANFPRWGRANTFLFALLLAAVNVYVLGAVIYPAYWKPTQPSLRVDTRVAEAPQGAPQRRLLQDDHSFAQSFIASHDNLSTVDIELRNEDPRFATGEVTLRLKSTLADPADLADRHILASALQPGTALARLAFPPIVDSKGKTYYLLIDAAGFRPGHGPDLLLATHASYPEGNFFIDGVPQNENVLFRSYYKEPLEPCPTCLVK